jgi:hypothetical protein
LRVDENSGERVENYGGDLSIAADTPIVKDSVFAAINIIYDPEMTRLQSTGVWQREATLGFLAAITTRVQQGVFLGAEARYLRKYDALDVTSFAGDALFIGPTMFVRFSKTLAISGAWDFQAIGHATGAPGSLDLVNFTRSQALFRVEYNL